MKLYANIEEIYHVRKKIAEDKDPCDESTLEGISKNFVSFLECSESSREFESYFRSHVVTFLFTFL